MYLQKNFSYKTNCIELIALKFTVIFVNMIH